MSLNLNDKKAVVAEISAKVAKAQTIVVAEYRGIQVGHLTQLRAKARTQGVYLRVLKNTLARRAVEGTAFASLASEMTGPSPAKCISPIASSAPALRSKPLAFMSKSKAVGVRSCIGGGARPAGKGRVRDDVVRQRRIQHASRVELLSRDRRPNDREDARANHRANAQRGKRPRPERLFQRMLGFLRVADQLVDRLAGK